MNALETMRQALAAVQVAYSKRQYTTNWLTKNIDQWEAWTDDYETRKQIEKRLRKEERFARKYRKPTKEDSWTFYEDRRLFSDSDFEVTSLDLFETLSSTWIKKDQVFDKKTNKWETIHRVQEVNLDRIIFQRLIKAQPNSVPEDADIALKNDLRASCQLDRVIMEDCTNSSSNKIEIPQLIKPGDCNIPAHLRIEEIKQFSPTIKTLEEAQIMSRVLKGIGLGFIEWAMKPIYKKIKLADGSEKYVGKSLSKRVNEWTKTGPNRKPWMAPVGKDNIPLFEIAEELFLMSHQEQENPEWAKEMEYDDLIAFFPADWKQPEVEDELASKNMVGEYTYHNISKIPNGKEFRKKFSKFKPIEFLKIIGQIDNMTNEEITKFSKEVKKKGSFEQKDRWLAESRRVLNGRAREEFTGQITIIPAALEPIDTDEQIETMFERMDSWQIDETGRKYEEYQDDPEEDILDDYQDVA